MKSLTGSFALLLCSAIAVAIGSGAMQQSGAGSGVAPPQVAPGGSQWGFQCPEPILLCGTVPVTACGEGYSGQCVMTSQLAVCDHTGWFHHWCPQNAVCFGHCIQAPNVDCWAVVQGCQ